MEYKRGEDRKLGTWSDNFRTRIPSLTGFFKRAFADKRRFTYDLLPLFTHPKRRSAVSKLFALIRPKTSNFSPSETAKAYAQELTESSIVLSMPSLSESRVAELRNYFESIPCHDPFRKQLGSFAFNSPPSSEINMASYTIEQIMTAPHVLEIFNDPDILHTAELYLGCKPLLDNISIWWSYPSRPEAKGTQRYHRDLDSFGGFKFFLYLTDVDKDSGPHTLMKGSNHSAKLGTGTACPDNLIHATFGIENEVQVLGPAGTCFIADTFAFHKGLLPNNEPRLMMAAQYTVNATPHLPKEPFLSGNPVYDFEINQLIMKSD